MTHYLHRSLIKGAAVTACYNSNRHVAEGPVLVAWHELLIHAGFEEQRFV